MKGLKSQQELCPRGEINLLSEVIKYENSSVKINIISVPKIFQNEGTSYVSESALNVASLEIRIL
jgi:hypothetical protein